MGVTSIWGFFNSLYIGFEILLQATVLVYPLMLSWGLPEEAAAFLSMIVYFSYAVTLVEFLRGKDLS